MKAQLYNNYKVTLSNSVVPAATMGDDFYIKAMEMKRQQAAERARQAELEEETSLRKAQAKIDRVKEVYQSITTFPSSFSEGWYNVISTDNYEFCAERQVYVSDQRVTRYNVNGQEREVTSSSVITKGKAVIKIRETEDFLDLYFLESLLRR
jgi:hypothetical protein